MASSRFLISSTTLTGSQATVTFSSIPSTYTDLVLKISARSDTSSATYDTIQLTFNGTSTGYSDTWMTGSGSAATSGRDSSQTRILFRQALDSSTATSNTFNNAEIYIPSYTASQNKPLALMSAMEDNATLAYINATAGLWSNTAAITSISVTPLNGTPLFLTGSSFYLYGLKNS